MTRNWLSARGYLTPTNLAGVLIFFLALVVFRLSPVTQVSDSNYSMLLSQGLSEHHSFLLDHYAIPRLPPKFHDNTYQNGDMHQIELVPDNSDHVTHFYYYFPPGTSIISTPFVALMNAFGVSAANRDGTHNLEGETKMQAMLAGFLMAILAVVFLYSARLMLPLNWSIVVALGSTFGTQVWSTASRAMWTETWSVLLLGVVVWMLLGSETSGRRLNPFLLGTLLAWTYFVRPTNAVPILAISAYLFLYHRRAFIRFAVTGAVWLAMFVAYSWYHFHQVLPYYYFANRLSFQEFWIALPGNIISPSRGLLIFVPLVFFIAYLLVRYWQQVAHKRLVWLSLAVMTVHMIVIAGFKPWNGGFSYGPRYSTALVPWLVLLAILGIRAMLDWHRQSVNTGLFAWRAKLACGALLLLLSILLNARGAISRDTWVWNVRPTNVDSAPLKVWDWRQPQFLAGWVRPPLPATIPALTFERINFAATQADPYLWFGWSTPDPESRWTEAKEAGIVFSLSGEPRAADLLLRMKLSAFIVPGRHPRQRVNVFLNGTNVDGFVVEQTEPLERTITLPAKLLRMQNQLTFALPDAASPASFGLSNDDRPLGIAVYWMQVELPVPGSK